MSMPSNQGQGSTDPYRSPLFWLGALFIPLVVGLGIVGLMSIHEKWNARPLPVRGEDPVIESATFPHHPKERKIYLHGKIGRINSRIQALSKRVQSLQEAIKKDHAGPPGIKDGQAYLEWLRKEDLNEVMQRLEELEADKAYYVEELKTIEAMEIAKSNAPAK